MAHRKPLAAAAVAVAGLSVLLMPSTAGAQPFRRGRVHGAIVVGGFYDPFFYAPFAPFGWGYGWGPYGGYGPYGVYGYGRPVDSTASARLLVTPKEAEVFVDGYRAGKVDDFDGAFQRLHVTPGPHEITFFLDGYRTITEKLYLGEGSTMKVRETMVRLSPGETSERPPAPAPRRRSRSRADGEGSPDDHSFDTRDPR